ncbi:sigma-54-dependent Fis family transcriptional regulator [Psychromonas marina]|uniref:Nif-specific regulatory protein n=1 Tax=Psychromonas marina TaxID=88364 RepID=A0ABQ6E565_9GAMM|nr:nif-specific transcriptional activator NifA [Psychromonas marina]GLS92517.1 sigma-54-dependent Fis family transcriptional regulator [Psychromonas marina]
MEESIDTSQQVFNAERQLNALHRISVILSQSLNMEETLQQMLCCLHEMAGMQFGMVTLYNDERQAMLVQALHGANPEVIRDASKIRYRINEGILGNVQARGESQVIAKVSQDPRFLDRLSLYDYDLPLICVPLGSRSNPKGVLAAQPMNSNLNELSARTRFLEMVANLILNSLQLSTRVQQEKQELQNHNEVLQLKATQPPKANMQPGVDFMVGHTAAMQQIFEAVKLVAKFDTTVLVRGESGTGKELIATSIAANSPRANAPFIKLNCAALPDNLLESELFGHEKGAFTGAVKMRKGRFELADGGTLFLDEIGEISASFQAKLLRVLQEGEFERVGGHTTIKVDVRIVAATNRPLELDVRSGDFREDLYYRLNVMPIHLPALRDKLADLPDLARFLINKIAKRQRRTLRISEGAIRLLMGHNWPGNIRELENCLERAAVMSESGLIDRDVVMLNQSSMQLNSAVQPEMNQAVAQPMVASISESAEDERQRVINALEQSGWVQAKAARLLGMSPRQIAYRIQTMNIHVRRI